MYDLVLWFPKVSASPSMRCPQSTHRGEQPQGGPGMSLIIEDHLFLHTFNQNQGSVRGQ